MNNTNPEFAPADKRFTIFVGVCQSSTQKFSLTIDSYDTFQELKNRIALTLQLPFSYIIIERDGKVLNADKNDIVGYFLQANDEIFVRFRGTDPPRRVRGSPTHWESCSKSAISLLNCQPTVGDDQYARDLELSLALSHNAARSSTPSAGRESTEQTFREIYSDQRVERKPPPILCDVTGLGEQATLSRSVQDFGRVVVRGSISQYSVGGVSSCTSICLVTAQWLLRKGSIEHLSSPLLDSLVADGASSHNTKQHTGLDDIWPSSTYAEGLERSVPMQSKASVDNFIVAFKSAWQYAVDQGKHSVAVIFTKSPETVLCFGTEDDKGLTWYLIDSHGEPDRAEKVAYVVHFPSTVSLAEALGVKYSLLEMDAQDHYTMEMFCQFEATPLVAQAVEAGTTRRAIVPAVEEPKDYPVDEPEKSPTDPRPPEHSSSLCNRHISHTDGQVVQLILQETDDSINVSDAPPGMAILDSGDITRRSTNEEGQTTEKDLEFIRTLEEAKAANDLLVAVAKCPLAARAKLKYALDTANRLRCMVTCCANITEPESMRSCYLCGRVVCGDCRQFCVSSETNHDSLHFVCLDCGSHILDSVILPSQDADWAKAVLWKTVIQPRIDRIYSKAKILLTDHEQRKAWRRHKSAIIELKSRIAELEDEKSFLIGGLDFNNVDEDGDFSMVSSSGEFEGDEHRPPDPPQAPTRYRQEESETTTKSADRVGPETFESWSEAVERAGRDRWPLPFGLLYPTMHMRGTLDLIRSDLAKWVSTVDFEGDYLAERERLRETRDSLMAEVTCMRQYRGGTNAGVSSETRKPAPNHPAEHPGYHQARRTSKGGLEL